METNNSEAFESKVHDDLYRHLLQKGLIDSHLPVCPDVEEKCDAILKDYLPDGAREFQNYPVVSLGWMMFVGMAMAWYWDTDWEHHSQLTDQYIRLRDKHGFDNLDETALRDVLGYDEEQSEKVSAEVAECASRVLSLLNHEPVEPGTPAAFHCYVAALRQLYLMGMAMELAALGYHMTPMQSLN